MKAVVVIIFTSTYYCSAEDIQRCRWKNFVLKIKLAKETFLSFDLTIWQIRPAQSKDPLGYLMSRVFAQVICAWHWSLHNFDVTVDYTWVGEERFLSRRCRHIQNCAEFLCTCRSLFKSSHAINKAPIFFKGLFLPLWGAKRVFPPTLLAEQAHPFRFKLSSVNT